MSTCSLLKHSDYIHLTQCIIICVNMSLYNLLTQMYIKGFSSKYKLIYFYVCLFIMFFLVDDVQVSCYRILTSLYALGTGKNIYVERYPSFKIVFQHWLSSLVFSAGFTHSHPSCAPQTAASSRSVFGHPGWGSACCFPGATA